jgi:predicted dehydrogenase
MNRRTFVSSLAVAGTAAATLPSRLFAADTKLRAKAGLIGCGWLGGVILESMAENADVEFVSLCDPNKNALAAMLQTVAKHQKTVPKTFADYREMLADGAHDVVIVSTPDHWHALPAIAAMKAGADVFLEKPIGVDVIEGEALVAAARKYQRVVQVNTQRRSNPMNVKVREQYIRSGRLGPIGVVETFCYLPMRLAKIVPSAEPPPHLDYDRWTGPAPMRPFLPMIESKGWRAFMEYGNGIAGDMGVHLVDHARWMLGLGWPESVTSFGGIYVDKTSSSNISDTLRSVFRYPGLDLSWEHRTWGISPIPQRHWTDQWGTRFIGKNGTLSMTMLGYEYVPADGGPREGFHALSKTGNLENIDLNMDILVAMSETQRQHVLDFMNARTQRSRPIADIEEGHISSACCGLANLSQELGRPLTYEPKTRTISGDTEATRRLARAYRAPWVHPDPTTV